MLPEATIEPQTVRAFFARKTLADSRQRAAAAALLDLAETDVLAIQHLAWAGALTPSGLADQLELTSGGASALIRRLERAGYVTREPHPADRRSSLLRLSDQGRRRAEALYQPLIREMDELTAALGDDERAVVARFLSRLAELAEAHAAAMHRDVAQDPPHALPVPVPGLWS